MHHIPDVLRRGRHPRVSSLAPMGQFAFCPYRPAYFISGGISPPAGGEPLLERSKRGEKIAGGRLRRAPSGALSRPPPGPPCTRGAWFGGLTQMYRRGATSDTTSFSRPLPLCGIGQRNFLSTRLDAPPLVLPRGATVSDDAIPSLHHFFFVSRPPSPGGTSNRGAEAPLIGR